MSAYSLLALFYQYVALAPKSYVNLEELAEDLADQIIDLNIDLMTLMSEKYNWSKIIRCFLRK